MYPEQSNVVAPPPGSSTTYSDANALTPPPSGGDITSALVQNPGVIQGRNPAKAVTRAPRVQQREGKNWFSSGNPDADYH